MNIILCCNFVNVLILKGTRETTEGSSFEFARLKTDISCIDLVAVVGVFLLCSYFLGLLLLFLLFPTEFKNLCY